MSFGPFPVSAPLPSRAGARRKNDGIDRRAVCPGASHGRRRSFGSARPRRGRLSARERADRAARRASSFKSAGAESRRPRLLPCDHGAPVPANSDRAFRHHEAPAARAKNEVGKSPRSRQNPSALPPCAAHRRSPVPHTLSVVSYEAETPASRPVSPPNGPRVSGQGSRLSGTGRRRHFTAQRAKPGEAEYHPAARCHLARCKKLTAVEA